MTEMSPGQAQQLLGVPADATDAQIRRAYRRKAREDHPDAGGDPTAFVRLQEALEVLVGRDRPPPVVTSPSTGAHRRPSTDGPLAAGWGESAREQWHEGPVDLGRIDWDSDLPHPPHRWSVDELARALAAPGQVPVGLARGLSRKPGSLLNRTSAWLSDDLFSRWTVGPSRDRGHAGHDVEVRLHFPTGPGRKVADRSDFPLGWVVERRPSSTVVVRVVHPSRQVRGTAVRAATSLSDLLDAIGWPLHDWLNVPDADA